MILLQKVRNFFQGSPLAGEGGEERRRFYRYRVPPDFPLSVYLPSLGTVRVKDIGLGGVSVVPEKKASVALGDVSAARLILLGSDSKEMEIRVAAVRIEDSILVFQFLPEEQPKMKPFRDLFPTLLGLSLQQRTQGTLPCRWFHGQCYTDLFVWDDHFLFVFENHVLEWYGPQDQLRTGSIVRERYSVPFHFHEETPPPIQFQERPASGTILTARRILRASRLPEAIKNPLLALLPEGQGEPLLLGEVMQEGFS